MIGTEKTASQEGSSGSRGKMKELKQQSVWMIEMFVRAESMRVREVTEACLYKKGVRSVGLAFLQVPC